MNAPKSPTAHLVDALAFHALCERIVDDVGDAFGVDTGVCTVTRFEAAMDAVESALLSDAGRAALAERTASEKPKRYLKETIVEPFPVFFGHVEHPSESTRATAVGPFYTGGVTYHPNDEKTRTFLAWKKDNLAGAGWTMLIEEQEERS